MKTRILLMIFSTLLFSNEFNWNIFPLASMLQYFFLLLALEKRKTIREINSRESKTNLTLMLMEFSVQIREIEFFLCAFAALDAMFGSSHFIFIFLCQILLKSREGKSFLSLVVEQQTNHWTQAKLNEQQLWRVHSMKLIFPLLLRVLIG